MWGCGMWGLRAPVFRQRIAPLCPILQVSTPSTAHMHCTRTCTHPDGTDVWASGGMFGRVRVRLTAA
eukprot:1568762-Prymnesium_polylepis.2